MKGSTEWNLGYRLARPFWGLGLATEAAAAALDHAFEERRFDSIIVLVEPDHAASLRVAEKIGFGRFETLSLNQQPVRLYRMRRSQWQQKCLAARAEAEMSAVSK